ncbi:MAG: hypothetical protein Q7K03_01970 [Dehalococcoidia bacterium]|nr:hypothetical protein [Dehalococcoidia bacterium]
MNQTGDTQLAESLEGTEQTHGGVLSRLRQALPSVGPGAVGGVISTVCCLLPAVALAIGLTGGLAAAFVNLGRFRVYGLLVGLGITALSMWLSLRRSRQCCTPEEYKRRQIAVPLTMLVSFGIVYGLVMYLVLPLLHKMD